MAARSGNTRILRPQRRADDRRIRSATSITSPDMGFGFGFETGGGGGSNGMAPAAWRHRVRLVGAVLTGPTIASIPPRAWWSC